MTPMMEQYFEIKNKYKHYLIFFRLGDFYELFFDDALIASKELEITLTGKNCGMEERAPMCGVPYHSVDAYIAKLVAKGYKVAICEQIEDAKVSKTLVKRDVVRVVTPGTILDTNVLDEGKNNYIMSVFEAKVGFGIAVCDVTTGEFLTTHLKKEEESRIADEIAKYNPSEIICNEAFHSIKKVEDIFTVKPYQYHDWAFELDMAKHKLLSHFKVMHLDGFGLSNPHAIGASGALMEYLSETQKNSLIHISQIRCYAKENFMVLDISSRKNLELTETQREKSKKGSLLWVLDKTKTAMGLRLLRKWIEQPLLDTVAIQDRLDTVEEFKDESLTRAELRDFLSDIFDIERILARVIYQTANAKDLIALKNSLANLPAIRMMLGSLSSPIPRAMQNTFDTLEDIFAMITETLNEDAPFSVREGGMIQDGYNAELDRYREAQKNGNDWLAELERKEKEETGIKNLKIRRNKVFGFYIEITNSNKDQVPDRYIRRQTLANNERFITPELKQIEEDILGADGKIAELEYEIFSKVRNEVAAEVARIKQTALDLATLDALQSLAQVADFYQYTKPEVDEQGVIDIKDGRHPVVEQLSTDSFIANDVYLDMKEGRLAIITGPNMAGKSTYMRQTALIVLMAQLGSFVPARYAKISVADRIFTRVGASDDLATGQSTFMVEMTEVANILNSASERSLLILDEIGRGTSTFDGLSIAWSVLEYIANKIGAKTLFATHYHELTELEGKIFGVKNYYITVEEQGDHIIFLRKVARGGAESSYGIQVARLAGIPSEVLDRAKAILSVLNDQGKDKNPNRAKLNQSQVVWEQNELFAPVVQEQKLPPQPTEEQKRNSQLVEELSNIDVDSLAPRDALQVLYDLHRKANTL